MANLTLNVFASWELSYEESRNGSIFTIDQTYVLQNQLAKCAEEKLSISFDPKDPMLFMQQEAYKRGQIDLLGWLLELSEVTKKE